MNEFNKNEQMEQLARLSEKQPDLYAQLPATTKISLGIYESGKQRATHAGLTPDEHLRLRGLKQSIAGDNLSPKELIVMALEITNLEKNIGDK